MKAYTVNHFWKDILHGKYMLDFHFALPLGTVKEKLVFVNSEADGITYLESDKNTWFKVCVEFILEHAKKIEENTINEDRMNALSLCQGFYNSVAYKTAPVKELCSRFITGQRHFYKIIQHASPDETLLTCVNELIKFCQQELK